MPNYNSLVRNESGADTFPVAAGANLAIGTRVKLNADGTVIVATATDYGFAVIDSGPSLTSPPLVAVRFLNAPGSQFGIAAAQINVGDTLYSAANGQVGVNATNTVIVGKAVTAAASANIQITYIPGTVF